MTSTPAAPLEEERLVTFWDITRKQYAKNRPAMLALWLLIAIIVLATAAPLISMNAPYVMKSENGVEFPLFDQIFNRLIFKSGVDIFFSILLFLAPVWWFGTRALRAAFGFTRLKSGLIDKLWPAAGEEIVDGLYFSGRGRGHGVGLCQVGARDYARQGWSADQILAHYYAGAQVVEAIGVARAAY